MGADYSTELLTSIICCPPFYQGYPETSFDYNQDVLNSSSAIFDDCLSDSDI